MTVETCLKLLETYKKRIALQGSDYAESNPDGRGNDSDERATILRKAKAALQDMKDHIISSATKDGKFAGHEILNEFKVGVAKPKKKDK